MSKALKIYAIPGLGLNKRIYDRLILRSADITVLEWQEPNKNESLTDYALRFAQQIPTSKDPIVLIGHSFGGVLSQEIAQHISVKQIILVSSIKSRAELSFSFRIMPKLGAHLLMSRSSILGSFPLWAKSNGYNTPELKEIFKDSVLSLSSHYMRWALHALTTWQGIGDTRTSIMHIHGTADKTLPFRYINKPDYIISDGDHIMVYSRAEEISSAINDILNNQT